EKHDLVPTFIPVGQILRIAPEYLLHLVTKFGQPIKDIRSISYPAAIRGFMHLIRISFQEAPETTTVRMTAVNAVFAQFRPRVCQELAATGMVYEQQSDAPSGRSGRIGG
ncbi:MAG: hypothetical protein ACREIC_26835, partial [Limisphaerales bacterium]